MCGAAGDSADRGPGPVDPAAGVAGRPRPAEAADPSTLSAAQVLRDLRSSSRGLASSDAEERLRRYGPNAIVHLRATPGWVRYLAQFKDWMIILLVACALVTAYIGDLRTAAVLAVLVVINTLIGYVQEYRAERTMRALEHLVEPTAEVYRDGRLQPIESQRLVPGDLVRLAEGATVPADMRIVEQQALTANEMALTGESQPARKNTRRVRRLLPIADRRNCAWAGTTVASGEGLGVVTRTGVRTELGRIASLSQAAPEVTSPLQRDMNRIASSIASIVFVLSLILLVVAIRARMPFHDALLFAVGFASALVPQGLPAEVSTSLAQASGTLARHGALVKRLSAVETLGATQVICTDKTGTLTKNEMTVVEALIAGRRFSVAGVGYAPRGALRAQGPDAEGPDVPRAVVARFLGVGVLASNAHLVTPDAEHPQWRVLGDPTEGALLTLAAKGGIDPEGLRREEREVRELPFDSVRKRMASVRRVGDRLWVCVKGSPESVLARCTRIAEGGLVRPLSEDDRRRFAQADRERAGRALRDLAYAAAELDPARERFYASDAAGVDAIERDLTLLGMVSMIDPLRETVHQAIGAALGAGIRVDIVTGDSPLTAGAIARQAGLGAGGVLRVIAADELHAMPDAEVQDAAIRGGAVFSRVNPEDKMRIVQLVRSAGRVVAVTGDGINDAPALKHADIGVAMGRTGTDVAKESAELVLLDDSFATLVRAIREGRRIYANIHKSVLACLTSNVAEFVVNTVSLWLAIRYGLPLAIGVLQILAIDLLGEIVPISTLGADPEEGEAMRQRPRDPRVHILNLRTIGDVAWTGTLMGALAMGAYLLSWAGRGLDPFGGVTARGVGSGAVAAATTLTYATILVVQLATVAQRRSVHGIATRYQLSNRAFWLGVAFGLATLLGIVYVPGVAAFFGTAPLGWGAWGLIGVAVVIQLAGREAVRLVRRSRPVR